MFINGNRLYLPFSLRTAVNSKQTFAKRLFAGAVEEGPDVSSGMNDFPLQHMQANARSI
jgi:hypothetical protein